MGFEVIAVHGFQKSAPSGQQRIPGSHVSSIREGIQLAKNLEQYLLRTGSEPQYLGVFQVDPDSRSHEEDPVVVVSRGQVIKGESLGLFLDWLADEGR